MDAATLKGIVYLILTVAVIAGVVIAILAWKIDRMKKRSIELESENSRLENQLAVMKDRKEVEGKTDAELLVDLRKSLVGPNR